MKGKNAVIKAIRARGNTVTVADIVSDTDLTAAQASKALNTIAAETYGVLSVVEGGRLIYTFDKAFHLRYFGRGIKQALGAVFAVVFQALFFVFRISFGLTLIASIFLFYAAFFLFYAMLGVFAGTSDAVNQMKDDFIDLLKRLALSDLLVWNWNRKQPRQRPKGFLVDCFSYLFGAGDPNVDLQERKWKYLAQVIRENEGVVAPEQLAPYFGRNPDGDKQFLSVLAHFDGMPIITESGNIVYAFNSLMDPYTVPPPPLPPQLEERPWRFAELDNMAMRRVTVMIGINLVGAAGLYWLWSRVLPEKQLSGLPLVMFILSMYGLLFLIIPLVRLAFIQVLNRGIARHNQANSVFARVLEEQAVALRTKLLEADRVRVTFQQPRERKTLYTTEKQTLDQDL
jgi:hypothetical protein